MPAARLTLPSRGQFRVELFLGTPFHARVFFSNGTRTHDVTEHHTHEEHGGNVDDVFDGHCRLQAAVSQHEVSEQLGSHEFEFLYRQVQIGFLGTPCCFDKLEAGAAPVHERQLRQPSGLFSYPLQV